MVNTPKFWLLMAAFQLAFGLSVFGLTRQYYLSQTPEPTIQETAKKQSTVTPPVVIKKPGAIGAGTFERNRVRDPAELSDSANEFFAAKQYERAASLYEELLQLAPDRVEVYNNLGLTLHYLGRSEEALGKLNEGVSLDSNNQRIWLTLGFVYGQTGRLEQARGALEKAVAIDAQSDIGQSASSMLQSLP